MSDPFFYFIVICAVLIVGISKGGFGGGLGVLAVPIMSFVMPPAQAAAILLPVLCVMDLFGIWQFRTRFDLFNLLTLLPAAILGIAIGALSFHSLSEQHIKLMTGSMALIFGVYFLCKKFLGSNVIAKRASVVGGIFWGALSGFSSFSVHAGGPALNVYLLSQKLDKSIFVGTSIIFFAAVNYVKLIPYAWLGLFKLDNLAISFVLMFFAPLGVVLGGCLHKRINEEWFYLSCYGLLLLAGAKLFYEGIYS